MNAGRYATRAFTIIEMMVVLAIILVACGMAVTALSGFRGNSALQSAQMLQGAYNRCRYLAARTGRDHSVVFNNIDPDYNAKNPGRNVETPPWPTHGGDWEYDENKIHNPANHWYQIVDHIDLNNDGSTLDAFASVANYDTCAVGERYTPVDGSAFLGLGYQDHYWRVPAEAAPADTQSGNSNWHCFTYFAETDPENAPADQVPLWHRTAYGPSGDWRITFSPQGTAFPTADGMHISPITNTHHAANIYGRIHPWNWSQVVSFFEPGYTHPDTDPDRKIVSDDADYCYAVEVFSQQALSRILRQHFTTKSVSISKDDVDHPVERTFRQ